MDTYAVKTPVVLFIFNRPEETARMFAEVARARPSRLLVVADGPRNEAEAENCNAARRIVEAADWDCELLTNFSETNLGCKRRVSSGLEWVFSQFETAIILEDDCIPDPTFFRYCDELLDKYRHDDRVSMICGSTFLPEKSSPYSYYFSRYGHVWGWATWRRAWSHYDVALKAWPQLRETPWLQDVLGEELAANYWAERFDRTHAGEVDTWDYQWFFNCWSMNGLAAVPKTNLITNIGFGEQATHTKEAVETMSYLPVKAMDFPLQHPPVIERNQTEDAIAFRRMCPWAEPQTGMANWLRRHVSPVLPDSLRRSLSYVRGKRA